MTHPTPLRRAAARGADQAGLRNPFARHRRGGQAP